MPRNQAFWGRGLSFHQSVERDFTALLTLFADVSLGGAAVVVLPADASTAVVASTAVLVGFSVSPVVPGE